MLKYRLICNTTFTLSNLIGPLEEITLVGNPVKYIRCTSSSLPHVKFSELCLVVLFHCVCFVESNSSFVLFHCVCVGDHDAYGELCRGC